MKLFFAFQIKKYNTYVVLYMTETIKEEWNILHMSLCGLSRIAVTENKSE